MNWSLIPQVFYDLLARTMPGAILLTLSVAVGVGPEPFLEALIAGKLQAVLEGVGAMSLALLFSYLTGSVAGQVWVVTGERLLKRRGLENAKAIREAILLEHNTAEKAAGRPQVDIDAKAMPRLFVMQDHLRDGSEGDALRLLKLEAEARLCDALVVGFTFLGVVNAAFLLVMPLWSRSILEALLMLGVAMSFTRAERLRVYRMHGICVAWLVRCSRRLASSVSS